MNVRLIELIYTVKAYYQLKVLHNGYLADDGHEIEEVRYECGKDSPRKNLYFADLMKLKDKHIEEIKKHYENVEDFDFASVEGSYFTVTWLLNEEKGHSIEMKFHLEEILEYNYVEEPEWNVMAENVYSLRNKLKSIDLPLWYFKHTV